MQVLSGLARELGIELSPSQLQAFDLYIRLLTAERERAALTALTDRESVERRHFGEALALLRALERWNERLSPAIDIGTGAGFPGLPMKVVRPELEMTLLEATGKKADFLRRVVQELGLRDISVVHARAEELGHDPAHRGRYALALARAVAPLPTLVELALPFLQIGGVLATPKGSAAAREAREAEAALRECGGAVERVERLQLPAKTPAPVLVVVRKLGETPLRYPRRPGIPSKRPLQ